MLAPVRQVGSQGALAKGRRAKRRGEGAKSEGDPKTPAASSAHARPDPRAWGLGRRGLGLRVPAPQPTLRPGREGCRPPLLRRGPRVAPRFLPPDTHHPVVPLPHGAGLSGRAGAEGDGQRSGRGGRSPDLLATAPPRPESGAAARTGRPRLATAPPTGAEERPAPAAPGPVPDRPPETGSLYRSLHQDSSPTSFWHWVVFAFFHF